MDMPEVNTCEVSECSYNGEGLCHALAITVGDQQTARCDTFCDLGKQGGDRSTAGHVGACKMDDCAFNEQLECQAPAISVAHKGSEVDCMTYRTV
jgi:hypothetical protein